MNRTERNGMEWNGWAKIPTKTCGILVYCKRIKIDIKAPIGQNINTET